MNLSEKIRQVFGLYEAYERIVEAYKAQAVCAKGCASCCIEVGSVGATTLEGLIILDFLQGWGSRATTEINRRLRGNRSKKLNSVFARCAFLDEGQRCRIYPVRPFSCRRLYSVQKCDGHGPVVHRQAFIVGQQKEKELQLLDPAGCSGHLSFILHLLEKKAFRRVYLQGNWNAEDFKDLIERYQLVVHRDRTSPA